MFAARGGLITESFARDVLPALPGVSAPPPPVRRALESWAHRCDETLGPASSVRAVADVATVPLLQILGYRVVGRQDSADRSAFDASSAQGGIAALATAWGASMSAAWRSAVLNAVVRDVRWCICCNGRAIRIVDGRRTWSREHLELDVPVLGRDAGAQTLLWSVARAGAMSAPAPILDRIVELSHRHGIDVCRALGEGVLEALQHLLGSLAARTRQPSGTVFEQSLTVLYRVLFLLFAEARGLLPIWHPLYRDRYSLETIVASLAGGRPGRGLWQAVRAISRLAHAGCHAGELRVTAFNGRLFAPSHAAAFESGPVPDPAMRSVLVAVSTTASRGRGRARIAYADLDVEQLGAVYEQVLDYEPCGSGRHTTLRRTGDVRKSTGTFYTPRPVTAFLVRHTLEPLVRGRSSAEILALRILDPAMGSGAFLVAACRYLAKAAEEALVREGSWRAHETTSADRAALRREIASTCLFGVDLNPMAVQLARLSLWLATLAGDKPLSFLDHHLIVGDSLVGATPGDVSRAASGGRIRRQRTHTLPLFDDDALASTLEHAIGVRLRLTAERDDSPAIVRSKEQTLAALQARHSDVGRWSRVMDLWCAGWFLEDGARPDARTFAELTTHIVRGQSSLPDRVAAGILSRAEEVAARARFLHWPLAFPEVFATDRGEPLPNAGFDAVLGNPPWDMVRGDSGQADARAGRRTEARRLTDFVRASGVYRVTARSHVNRYQLFVERALQLVRTDGRIGLVLPSGAVSDTGSAALRRYLFEHSDIDEVTGIDNREGIFPIHRGLRFVLLTCTRRAGPGSQDRRQAPPPRCRFGITRTEELERHDAGPSLLLARPLLARLSGEDDLGIPELASEIDLRILERLVSTFPRLGDGDGWGARFGRELNASDDRDAFTPIAGEARGRPVLEGKLIEPFRVALDRCRLELPAGAAVSDRIPRRTRLAYRDVASPTNRLTLIAALVPARAVTTHTLFCLKSPLPVPSQHVLCGLLNSLVANYLVRLRVNMHVTLSLVSRLPVPLVHPSDAAFDRLERLARALSQVSAPADQTPEYAELQAVAAALYGLDRGELEHVLQTFPLIAGETKEAVLRRFTEVDRPHTHGPRRLGETETGGF